MNRTGKSILQHLVCIFLIWITAFSFCSCKDKEVYERLDKIETTITDMQKAIKELQDAYVGGKVIKSVKPFEDNSGWTIIYSDGSKSEIYNGKDGITPYIKSDVEGYWIASYDNGKTFQPILDEQGDKIMAIGVDGKDGQDGEEGLSIRVTVNEDSLYVIETYKESDPGVVISESVTPYTANASRVITKIEQDEKTHAITLTLADGSALKFNTFIVSPTGIAVLTTNALHLSFGTQVAIEFRINPSNANISFGEGESDCQLELDKVGTASVKSSYVTKPDKYKLVRIEQVYNPETQEQMTNQFRAIIEDTKSGDSYDEMVAFVLNYNDGNNDRVQLSSSAFEVICSTPEIKTGLPICYLNTPNAEPITSKTEWLSGATLTILNPDMSTDFQGTLTLSIKGRGNSSWNYPKKPYTIKLDKKNSILGMNEHKKWVLLANWMDRTLMRNAVAFEISRKTGLAWTPDGRFVELVLNGEHVGNYYICEKICVDEKRVDIAKLDNTVTDPELITGGYLFELDTNYDEKFKFKSPTKNLPYMFSDPDEINTVQQAYAEDYVSKMELVICGMDKTKSISEFINIESFVDWWFVTETTMNTECNWPKSCFIHKNRAGRMTAGPVWDFDWGTFTPYNAGSFAAITRLYYPELFKNQIFVSVVKQRWPAFKSSVVNDIPKFIDDTQQQLELSDGINSVMWPITGAKPNGDEDMSFDEAVERLKGALLQKVEWLDGQINAL